MALAALSIRGGAAGAQEEPAAGAQPEEVLDAATLEGTLGLLATSEIPSFTLKGSPRRGLFANSQFYLNFDFNALRWPSSWILMPACLGLERTLSDTSSMFVEAGLGISLSGLETFSPMLDRGTVFPTLTLGLAFRKSGDRP
jgi:hypothetical protein